MSRIMANDCDDNDDDDCLIINNTKFNENRLQIFRQISLPLFVAGFGMVLAGILLDHIKVICLFVFDF